jgi:voltage-gated potassium channel
MPLLVAALLVIPMLILDQANLDQPWRAVEAVLDWGTWLVFFAELVVMLSIVPDRRRWLREHPIDVVATVFSPPILPSSLALARLLRMLRVLRLLKLAPIARRVFSLEGLRYAALLAFLTLIGGGTAFAAIEHRTSEWEGIWWAAETMTTVGYGDIVPHTVGGRAIGIAVMVIGIGFGTLLVGAIAERFVLRDVEEAEEERESDDDELRREIRAVGQRLERIELALLELRRGE